VGKTETGETESESTPVTSHLSPNGRANIQPRSLESPVKSLADMAADSVMITDYSQLKTRRSDEAFLTMKNLMISSGIGATATISWASYLVSFVILCRNVPSKERRINSVQETSRMTLSKEDSSQVHSLRGSADSVSKEGLALAYRETTVNMKTEEIHLLLAF
jgi:hypothetical protein